MPDLSSLLKSSSAMFNPKNKPFPFKWTVPVAIGSDYFHYWRNIQDPKVSMKKLWDDSHCNVFLYTTDQSDAHQVLNWTMFAHNKSTDKWLVSTGGISYGTAKDAEKHLKSGKRQLIQAMDQLWCIKFMKAS